MSHIRILLFVLLATLPLAGQEPQPAPAPAAPAPESPEANKAVVSRYLQILDGGTFDDLDQVVGPDYVDCTPGAPAESQGPGAVRDAQGRARALFQDIHYKVDDLIAEGDRVAARYTVRAARKSSGGESKPVEVIGVTVFRLSGGKIRETWIVNDQIALFRQLGFTIKAPEPEGEKAKPAPPKGDL